MDNKESSYAQIKKYINEILETVMAKGNTTINHQSSSDIKHIKDCLRALEIIKRLEKMTDKQEA